MVGVICNAAAVPINPDLTMVELQDRFASLRLSALLVPERERAASEARKAAERQAIPVIRVGKEKNTSLGITLRGTHAARPVPAADAGPNSSRSSCKPRERPPARSSRPARMAT